MKKKITVALQGGGAHGAFAWGVLDRLLEDGRFDIVGVSGTSAGGMNAAAVIQGLIHGGESRARELLYEYWKGVSDLAEKISPMKMSPLDKAMNNFNLNFSPGYGISKMFESFYSPYEMNPLDINPFFDYLKGFFDFEAIRNCKERRLFLGATNVKTGKVHIFSNDDFSAEVLLASACLPFLFRAVEIKGEHYWDGGYIANPAIFPLINECTCSDIIIVQLTRTHCDEVPKTHSEIVDRLKEITYNGCLVREMRAIYFITKMIDEGKIKPDSGLSRVNMHLIKNEDVFRDLNLSSALNTDWSFLTRLRDAGRRTASLWIASNYDRVGQVHQMDEAEAFVFRDFMS